MVIFSATEMSMERWTKHPWMVLEKKESIKMKKKSKFEFFEDQPVNTRNNFMASSGISDLSASKTINLLQGMCYSDKD